MRGYARGHEVQGFFPTYVVHFGFETRGLGVTRLFLNPGAEAEKRTSP